MSIKDIIASIDAEISRLEQARALLAGSQSIKLKRTLSAAARKKIADAQRRRWAAVKRTAK